MRVLMALCLLGTLLAVGYGGGSPARAACSSSNTSTTVGAEGAAFNASSREQDATACPAGPTGPSVQGTWQQKDVCTIGGETTCAAIELCPDGQPKQEGWYQQADGGTSNLTRFCPTDEPPGPTPADIYTAFKTIPLPTPDLHIQPPGGQTLVNLPTIYYTRPTTIDTTLTVLGTTIDFHITTATYTWHYGDHTTTTTTTPGAPYPHQTNTHTYPHHGTIHPSLDTTYQADYRIHTGNTTGQWQHLTPTVTITGPPHTLTIHTATPHLTGE
jgi:hypothetical protein